VSAWAVVGDGQWGRALARRLKATGNAVTLVGEEGSGTRTPRGISLTRDLGSTLADVERVVVAVPIGALEGLLLAAAPHLRGDHRLVTTCRGLTPHSHLRGIEAVHALTPVRQVAVLAGAADADALGKKSPVALVVGSPFFRWAMEIQDGLRSQSLRVYTNPDLVGVELSNILAAVLGVGLGAARSLAVGPAAEAMALTRALAEMDRVVRELGGRAGTAYGLAGLGVLSELLFAGNGVPLRAGAALAKGDVAAAAAHVELRQAAHTLAARAARQRLRAPLLEMVEGMFAGRVTAASALAELMNRASRPEGD